MSDRAFDVQRSSRVKDLGAGSEASMGDQAGAPRVVDGTGELVLIGCVHGDVDERSHWSGHPVSRTFGDVIGGKLGEVKRYGVVAHGESWRNRQLDMP
ncbi:hypothetical protein [Tenggerimyces flavus]|uniref:hypothetical protein n=1 Tax=Tenggerimyces flavus TaxID=1708749 RepID=UPI0036D7747B